MAISLKIYGMVPKEHLENTITIGFLNDKIEENLSFYKKNYDVVLTNEEATFYEVEKIRNQLSKS